VTGLAEGVSLVDIAHSLEPLIREHAAALEQGSIPPPLVEALYDAGVYTNVAIHPAVPPGGALLRTSLMATHTQEHLDRALAIIEKTIADFPDLPRV